MSLANKYRPSSFEDCVEQKHVVKILRNMCKAGMPCRNILLTGPAGCGKTTLGRLVARCLNESDSGIIEIDAASNNGVESARDLVQQARAFPIGSNYKVIIMDEAHALTKFAWDALLKVLEESPARTVFVFCTTNPEKIPRTILSRVQVFKLTKISTKGIYNRLKYALDSEIQSGESITYTDDAVMMIAKLACGGLRDAMTLLDKVISYSHDITFDSVSESLNMLNHDDFFELLCGVSKKDNERIIKVITSVYMSGVNYVEWFEQFHSFLLNVVKYIYTKDIQSTSIPEHYEPKIKGYTQSHAAICLRLASVIVKMLAEIKHTPYQQEIAMTYLCTTKGGESSK